MTFIKDDHSFWKCDRCDAKLSPHPLNEQRQDSYAMTVRYELIKRGPLVGIQGSDVLSDFCETCANEILEQRK